MTRVLLVCPEPLGHGQPAGIGIRFIEMANVLRADGHQVTLLSRDDTLTAEAIARATEENDVAVVQGHIANELFAHGKPLPTVVDLYDPFIVENLHYYSERGAEVFQHDHATLMSSIARGDFFLCASDAQRLFYLGVMLAAGRLSPVTFDSIADFFSIAPFGVQPARSAAPAHRGHNILFGAIYDWYDPIVAIDAVAIARKMIPDITLTFTKHPNPELTPQGKAADAVEHVRRRGYREFIRFEPWVAYDHRGEFFDRFALALLTFGPSIETDLSMRTRVFDYLWGGLPVISSSAPGTDEILERYQSGSVWPRASARDVPAEAGTHTEALATQIVALISDDRRLASMREGAARFVADHQWAKVLEPLREFCRSPRFDKRKDAFAVRMQLPERPPSILDRLKRRIGGAF